MRNHAQGFNLIELLITLTIISILSALSYPIYTAHLKQSFRLEAKTTLMELASEMEETFLLQHNYDKKTLSITETQHYTYQLSLDRAQHYRLSATPKIPDDDCGSFSLDELGVRSSSGRLTNASCW